MSIRGLGLASLLLLAACGGGSIEGRYYNSVTGEFAMELKGGKVISMQGVEGENISYEVRGDSLYLLGAGGMMEGVAFGVESNGDLSLGILGTLTKNRPD